MVREKAAEVINLNVSREKIAGGETAGAFLANARRAAGLSHLSVCEATKIKVEHLEAIEASDAGALPATPYAVGFVKVYAGFLGLDAEAIAAQFKTDIAVATPAIEAAPSAANLATSVEPGDGVRFVSIVAIAAILMFVLWIGFQVTGGSDREAAGEAQPVAQPRVTLERAPAPRPQISAEHKPAPIVESVAAPGAEAVDDVPPPVTVKSAEPTQDVLPATAPDPAAADGAETAVEAASVQEPAAASETPTEFSLVEETPGAPTDEIIASGAAPEAGAPGQTAPAPFRPARAPAKRPEATPEPVIVKPRLIRPKAPRYPNRCGRSAAPVEHVTVIFDVTPEGRTANARSAASTNDCFNDAALKAIAKWRFEPETINGAARLSTAQRATLNFRQ